MFDLHAIARYVFLAGVVLVVIGIVLWALAGLGLPLGRLPGDLRLEGSRFSCFVPLVSSILISLVLTLVLNILIRLLK